VDPSLVNTSAGAIELRNAALAAMTLPVGGSETNVIFMGGLLTDEVTEGVYAYVGPDERRLSDPTGRGESTQLYSTLHIARTHAQLARQALQQFAPASPKAWQGELLAFEGYTVLWFAEYYCSGIPLTALRLNDVSQLSAGYTTQELFARSVALFDSAIVVGADSTRFVNMARIGKARALLGLGEFAAADSAVRDVPTDFVYLIQFAPSSHFPNVFAQYQNLYYLRVQDNEGGNGLAWSTDPRPGLVPDQSASTFLRSGKYNVVGTSMDPYTSKPGTPFRLADGLEARLIQAEAALAAGDASWLTTLNTLRATCIGSAVCAPVPGLTTANLPATLTDPGNDASRLDLLFKERAMWLYLTGHRQGDLRRLAHVYHRPIESLWPTGTIVSPAFPPLTSTPQNEHGLPYGTDVVFLPDPTESVNNPLYAGCYDFNP